MAKGSAFTRVLAYFRTADIDEADAALEKAGDIVAERQPKSAAPKPRKPRKKATNAAEVTTRGEDAQLLS